MKSSTKTHKYLHGFTLVEMLTVIVIIGVLAAVLITFTSRSMDKARSASAMSNLRQCGIILLTDAAEKNNRFAFFSGGASGGIELRAYNIVRGHLGKTQAQWNNQEQNRCDIMHWNPKKLKPGNFHWDCYGVNFTDVPEFGVTWTRNNGRPDGSNAAELFIAAVKRPEAYPFLVDSSTSTGLEIFRIQNADLPGMRNSGKAHGFFLDGSAKSMDRTDLKKAGFTRAYDNSTKPPKLITL